MVVIFPPVDDYPLAQHVGGVDAQRPNGHAALGPANRRGDADRHRLVDRFEDTDRPRELI